MPKVPVSGEKKGSAIKTFPSEKTQQDTVTKRIRHSTDSQRKVTFIHQKWKKISEKALLLFIPLVLVNKVKFWMARGEIVSLHFQPVQPACRVAVHGGEMITPPKSDYNPSNEMVTLSVEGCILILCFLRFISCVKTKENFFFLCVWGFKGWNIHQGTLGK